MIIIWRGIQGIGKTTIIDRLIDGTSPDVKLDSALPPLFSSKEAGPGLNALGAYLQPIRQKILGSNPRDLFVVSADSYFMIDGEYRFDPKFLSSAHAQCLRRFTNHLIVSEDKRLTDDSPHATIIVDNTNCSVPEVAPYAALAGAWGHELHIITLLGDPTTAFARNTHGVPMTNVIKADLALRASILEWPPWFPQQIFYI